MKLQMVSKILFVKKCAFAKSVQNENVGIINKASYLLNGFR